MSVPAGVVFGIGNPLLDISAEVPQSLLEKYELKAGNAILAEPKHLPLFKELIESYDVSYIAGGATQNTIRGVQWCLQTPGASTYVGCVGTDEFRDKLEQAARRDGVNVQYMTTTEQPTGTCAVCIVKRERSLCANLGAANLYKLSHLMEPAQQQAIQAAKFFYMAGFFLTVSPESALHVATHASEHNKIFGLNLAAPFIIEFFGKPLGDMLPLADYVFGNEHEWATFGKVHNYGTENLGEIALRASALPKANSNPRTCIVTQGSECVLVCREGKIDSYDVPKVPVDEIVDTNGAGDSFVAGFYAGLVHGLPVADCVAFGNYVAGEVIRRSGASLPEHPPTFKPQSH